ncbi:MAG: hypothetical protein IPG92_15335 [Flavobacteriales bacterium]|nr:hypothetical protein [Flavobacteriales bacterium]
MAPIASVPIAEYARNGGKPWRYNANGIHYNEGNVGVGVSTPQAHLDVLNSMRISGDSLNSCELQLRPASNLLNNKFSSWDENGQLLWVLKMRDVFYGDAFGLYSEAANLDVLRIPPSGGLDVRANTNSKIRLYSANPSQENRISSYDESDDERWRINMLDQGDDDSFAIYSSDYGGSPLRVLHDGRTQAFCLEIMGDATSTSASTQQRPWNPERSSSQIPSDLDKFVQPADHMTSGS